MANFTLDQTGQEIQDILDTVGNNQATQGQVLTANGTGGANWQNASGGSGNLYRHEITLTYTDANTNKTYLIIVDIYGLSNYTYDLNTFLQFLNLQPEGINLFGGTLVYDENEELIYNSVGTLTCIADGEGGYIYSIWINETSYQIMDEIIIDMQNDVYFDDFVTQMPH